MAKRDLLLLLKEIQSDLTGKSGTAKFRASVPDFWQHKVIVEKEQIKRELRIQLAEFSQPNRSARQLILSTQASKISDLQSEQEQFLSQQGTQFNEAKVDALAQFYMDNLELQFKTTTPKGYTYELIKNATGFTVIFTPTGEVTDSLSFQERIGKQGPVFSALGIVFSNARLALNNQIKTQFKLNIDRLKETTFQIGHVTAVAQLRAGAVLSTIQSQNVNALLGTLQFTGLSELLNTQADLIKKFQFNVAVVKPQSAVANNLASKYDAVILNQVKTAVDKALEEMLDKDWANQPGSSSLIDAVTAQLIESATKRGAKVISGTVPVVDYNPGTAEASTEIEAELPEFTTTLTSIGSVVDEVSGNILAPTLGIKALIPELNKRLPEVVRSHMGQEGALTNRTGRFSESTNIVDIGDNNEIEYSYMLYPYEKFEKDDKRDPRPLIERSIREIATGLITDKFTMRRV